MDDDQQFCLRWNNHQDTLISVFDTLYENETFVDCTLAAEGKFLKAHKVILSACSPYFAALLSQQYDKHPIFILKDIKFQELRAMMDYMYRGEVNISQDQLEALLKAAESLQIKGLSDSCGGEGGNNDSTITPSKPQKSIDARSHLPEPPKHSGLTTENKRPFMRTEFDADVSGISVLPSTRKRRKVNQHRRSLAEVTNFLDSHDQHLNSSSHSSNHQQQLSTSAISAPSNNLSVINNEKTEQDGNKPDEETAHSTNNSKQLDETDNMQNMELLIKPKIEYDDVSNVSNVEDLTMNDSDQAIPSNKGESSSQGHHWQMNNTTQEKQLIDEQLRDAQASEGGLCITKIAGLTWEQWNERLAMPLVTTLREGGHPLVFPNDLCVNSTESSQPEVICSPSDTSCIDCANSSMNITGNATNAQQEGGFACPDCDRTYKLKSSLRNHQKWECGKEPQFQCPYCLYKAKQKMHIGRHMERMHKEKSFKVASDGKIIPLDEEALN